MVEKSIEVKNKSGLHARPASDFVKITAQYPCEVYLEKEGKKSNAKSILGVLALAISQGNTIKVITDGDKETEALEELVTFVESLDH